MEWRNWSGLESSHPDVVVRPGDTEAVVAAVHRARTDGTTVKMVGTGLGFPVGVVAVLGGGVCLVWRLLAMWRHWRAPMPTGPASV